MRYYLIAGEASGDLHGSGLVRELKAGDAGADIRAWGGDRMQAAGATLIKHYRDLAFMGFVEVVKHLGTIFRNISFAKEDILAFKPDVLVLIDYPGFNLRIAKWAKEQGIRVVYYISPQAWAWKEGRVKDIRRDVDQMLVILPFEVPFYDRWDYKVDYVGHPLVEAIQAEKEKPEPEPIGNGKPLVALLPGSRAQEIRTKLPIMLTAVRHFPDVQFAVAGAPSQPDSLYTEIIGAAPVQLVTGRTYELLRQARAALVTSGTATLETGLFGVPQAVCYKGHPVSYWLAKKLIKVKYISLVNLILDAPVVPELIQHELNEERLVSTLADLLPDTAARAKMLNAYSQLWNVLGGPGASAKAAKLIVDGIPQQAR
jgi:lipid-A-disaccharide synthase